MTGWTDDTCADCEVLNDTFILALTHLECYWLFSEQEFIDCGNGTVSITVELVQIGAEYRFYAYVVVAGIQYTYIKLFGNTNDVDCDGSHTLNYSATTGTSICNKPSTITIN